VTTTKKKILEHKKIKNAERAFGAPRRGTFAELFLIESIGQPKLRKKS
jgi:hypothetical protein